MFENYKTDDTTTTATPVAPSATEPAKTETKTAQPPAEAPKTETEPKEKGPVPYERFQEINAKFRETEAKLKTILGDDLSVEEAKIASDVQRTAKKDPTFSAEVNKIIVAFNKGELTKKEMKAEIKEAVAESADKVTAESPKVTQLETDFRTQQDRARKATVVQYKENFDSLAEADFPDKKARDLVEDRVSRLLLMKYPNAADEGFSLNRLKEFYKQAKEEFEVFGKQATKGYVKEKGSDEPPVTKTGTSGTAEEDFSDIYSPKASKAIAAGLRAARSKEGQ